MNFPKHVAIIMDGNGRWAQSRNLPRVAGHEEGAKAVRKIIRVAAEKGVEILTLFAFGLDNWGRPTEEVNFLMELFLQTLKQEMPGIRKNNIQLKIIGDYSFFNPRLKKEVLKAQQLTEKNTGLKLILAINYSGRWDILQATRKLLEKSVQHKLQPADFSDTDFESVLSFYGLPDPDLFIRTSGECRISNFMLWQLAYTELYFTDVLWPDFDEKAFADALTFFASRQRRFGLIGEQVQ